MKIDVISIFTHKTFALWTFPLTAKKRWAHNLFWVTFIISIFIGTERQVFNFQNYFKCYNEAYKTYPFLQRKVPTKLSSTNWKENLFSKSDQSHQKTITLNTMSRVF